MTLKYLIIFILLKFALQFVNGQTPQRFAVLQETIADVSYWNYGTNGHGPPYWPTSFPVSCAGFYQSPIDIRTRKTIYDPILNELVIFTDPPSSGATFEIHNTGHSVQVNTKGEFYVANGALPNIYKTVQFHLHWGAYSDRGSEHTIDSERAPLEMHIVSYNQKYANADEAAKYSDGLAAITVLYRLSEQDNPALEPIVRELHQIRDPDQNVLVRIPAIAIKHFLPDLPDRYFRYHGSLTTPNCSEAVTWTVFEQTQIVSERQLHHFRQMLTSSLHPETRTQRQFGFARQGEAYGRRVPLVDTFRPVQALNGRIVYRSFPYFDAVSPYSNDFNHLPCIKPHKFMKGYSKYPPHKFPSKFPI